MQEVKISINASHGTEDCTFTIHSDGTFEAVNSILSWDEECSENVVKKQKKLSKSQMKKIDELITKVKKSNQTETTPLVAADAIQVVAQIDTQEYSSLFIVSDEDSYLDRHINRELVDLTAELVDLSPIKLKGLKKYIKS